MIALPEAELSFYFAAQAQLEPELQPVFAARVANILDAYAPFCEPGPGDVDRAVRAAFMDLWVPRPDDVITRTPWRRGRSGGSEV